MQANLLLDLKKAKQAAEKAKCAMTTAATKTFGFYTNVLSVEAMYVWNKFITKQTASDPYIDLQGSLRKDQGEFHASHLKIA